MSSAANVEVRLKFVDRGANAGLRSISQQASQTAKGMSSVVSQAQRDIQAEILQSQRRYEQLQRSGKLSLEQLAAAATKMRQREAALRKESDRLDDTLGRSAAARYAANMAARESLGIRSEKSIRDEINKTQQAYKTLSTSGTSSARETNRAYDAQLSKVKALRQELGEVSKAQRLTQAAQVAASVAAGVVVAKTIIDTPVKSYADLEAAQADLKIALMTKGGKVSAAYDEIMAQSTDLGNKLPGATKDFVAAASALKEQGMTESAITGGGLTASAQFGVLADMNQYQSATTIAKMREAYGLGNNELPEMANLMQKSRYAYGIQPDDFRAVAAYAAPTYNTLGLTGLQHTKELLAVQGMAAGVGLENTSFGTNFAMMLQRTSQIDSRLGGKGEEAEEAREALAKFGIKLNFFDKEGKFAGIENMFAELDKLKPLKDIDRMHVLNKLFGTEASRPASIMIEKGGVSGFKESLAKLESQADIQERIAEKTSTLKAKEESLDGTWENTKASAGKELGGAKKQGLDKVNDWLGNSLQPTLDKNPGLGTGLTLSAAAVGGIGALASVAKVGKMLSAGAASGPGVLSRLWTSTANVAGKVPLSALKKPGLFGLGALAGDVAIDAVTDEGSVANRYSKAGLNGAAFGAMAGNLIPIPGVGAGIGALVGGAGGMAIQGLSDLFSHPAIQPVEPQKVDATANLNISLSPGLVIQQQTTQSNGLNMLTNVGNTGNAWSGAPG